MEGYYKLRSVCLIYLYVSCCLLSVSSASSHGINKKSVLSDDNVSQKKKCSEKCQNGDCTNINGIFKCRHSINVSKTGASFLTMTFAQRARSGRKCHDFCAMMSEMCRNGGACVQEESTCVGRCVCAPGWTGQWCRDPVAVVPYTDDIKSSTTPQNVNMVNHELNLNDTLKRTVNETIYLDKLLEKRLTSSKSISQNKPTTLLTSTKASVIISTIKLTDDTAVADENASEREKCIKNCLDGDCININGIFKCKHSVNISETSAPKSCGPGFVCTYGVCDMEKLKNNSYSCLCERNYVGQFCALKCPIDCGDLGYCDYDITDGIPKCFLLEKRLTSSKSILKNKPVAVENASEREKCIKNCLDGDCININGIFKCKHSVNISETSAPKSCGPGFVCTYGVCDMEKLKNNSYSCLCERNYVGQFCTLKCPIDCGNHGYCDYDITDGIPKCFCEWNYTGVNCSVLVILEKDATIHPKEVIFHWYVVGISIGLVITVVTSLVMVSYLMWKRRLVFMLKIVHYFQHYEEDDGKEYDAFISYKSTPEDEQFVLEKLYPKLELEYQFKLCMHFRDFLPGEAIANNIVKAIESSRRTIMILSPAYVESEWCRMEYQKAQHEMLKLKHKIIPIVLEDISKLQTIDKNLKSILNSVTYLEWPGSDSDKKIDKFWKKLELSLPKKSSYVSSSSSSSSNSLSLSSSDQEGSSIPSHISSISTNVSSHPELSECISSGSEFSQSQSTSPSPNHVTKSSSCLQSTKRDFRYYVDKLVKNRAFKRQDSSSSQAALVDEETITSRSSCDSVSELTESTESCCSTPVTAHSYLSDTNDIDVNTFFVDTQSSHKRVDGRKERSTSVCEKDHCEGVECTNCLEMDNVWKDSELHSAGFVNPAFTDTEQNLNAKCKHCKIIQNSSDNNRVRISAVDGGEGLRIQKLPVNVDACAYCNHVFSRDIPYRGSVKQHKDAANMQLLKQARNGSLPRNYKRSEVHARSEVTLRPEILELDKIIDAMPPDKSSFFIDICENV